MSTRVFAATALAVALTAGVATAADPPAVEADIVIFRVAPEAFNSIDCLRPKCDNFVITDEQARRVLVAVASGRNGEVLSAPKVVTRDGQPASVLVGGYHRWVSAARLFVVDGKLCAEPEHQMRDVGISVSVTPRLSNDRRAVELDMTASWNELDPDQPKPMPVTAGGNVVLVESPLIGHCVRSMRQTLPLGAALFTEIPRPPSTSPEATPSPHVCVLVTPRLCSTESTGAPPVLPVVAATPPMRLPECVSQTTCNNVPEPARMPDLVQVAATAAPPAPAPAVEADVMVVRLSPAGAQTACLAPGKGDRIFNDEQARGLLTALASDGNGQILLAPKLMTLDGQPATFVVGRPLGRACSTTQTTVGGEPPAGPERGCVVMGTTVSFTPRLSSDRQSVELDVFARMIEPACGTVAAAGGRKFNADSVNAKRVVPFGSTLCLDLPQPAPAEAAERPSHVCVLVTPRVCSTASTTAPPVLPVVAATPPMRLPECVPTTTCDEPPAPEADPPPAANRKLAKLMAKYDRACADGDVEKARKWALRCLEIDPTCFGK
jgi:hypothetical protein